MARRLFWLIMILIVLGCVVLSSASVVQATKLYNDPGYYWKHQLLAGILPGLLLMFAFWKFDYRHLRRLSVPILLLALAGMVLVLFPSIGLQINGSRSWIDVGPFTFQPAELLKFALIVYFAAWFSEHGESIRSSPSRLVPFLIVIGAVIALLLLQPDLGMLAIITLIAGGMYFCAGGSIRHSIIAFLIIVMLIVGYAATSPARWKRITTLFNPTADARGSGWQIRQSLIAIGSGGVFGVGLGQSTQKFGFLPEPIGDSIFAILVEELGIVGGFSTLILFLLLAGTILRIARQAPDTFGAMITLGVCLWIMIQAMVNMTAVTGLLPLTGVPLPFISYGGTSMAALLGGLGVVLSVAKHSKHP